LEGSNALFDAFSDSAHTISGTSTGLVAMCSPAGVDYQLGWKRDSVSAWSFFSGLATFTTEADAEVRDSFLLTLIAEIACELSGFYGEIRSVASPDWSTPFDLRVRLPDIPNISIYGPDYIAFFGPDRLKRAPFVLITQPCTKTMWLWATHDVYEVVPSQTRLALREALGHDSFMTGGRSRYRQGRSPGVPPLRAPMIP
jgi:hypothetical protein